MSNPLTSKFMRLFRLRSTLVLCGVAAEVLAGLGLATAALGVLIGCALFTLNCFFLYEAGHSLIKASSKGRGGASAALSSLGRFLFLAVALALVTRMGQCALFAACGGVFVGQVNLHLGYLWQRRIARCSST
jgi:hypothetical protein